jgi:hypothetical protein
MAFQEVEERVVGKIARADTSYRPGASVHERKRRILLKPKSAPPPPLAARDDEEHKLVAEMGQGRCRPSLRQHRGCKPNPGLRFMMQSTGIQTPVRRQS